jgi:hypothetical protein
MNESRRQILLDTPHTETATGAIASFETDMVGRAKEVKVEIEPVQEGTPWIADTTESVPYNFRAVKGTAPRIGNSIFESVVGGTVAWNQQISNFGKSGKQVPNGSTTYSYFSISTTIVAQHVYLFCAEITYNGAKMPMRTYCQLSNKYGSPAQDILAAGTKQVAWIIVATVNSNQVTLGISNIASSEKLTAEDEWTWDNAFLCDLTQMFGTTVADYIYSLETATPGAGVDCFRKLFPEDYYEYNPGELISVEGVSSHETIGFNQWDEEWEVGAISSNTGKNSENSTMIRSKNYIPVVPGMTYYLNVSKNLGVARYGKNKDFVSFTQGIAKTTLKIPSGIYYIRFYVNPAYGTTYNHDICINLSDPTRNGTYEPYTKHSYPLDSSLTIRGIPKLDANNKLYYDGDTYESDGTVTRKYAQVTLSNVTSSNIGGLNADTGAFRISTSLFPGRKYMGNILSAAWQGVTSGLPANMPDKSIYIDNSVSNVLIYCKDSAFIGKTAAEVAESMNGRTFVYELATPTTESADPFQSPQVIDEYGTEEYVYSGTRDVAIPVGHVTRHADIYPISGWDGLTVEARGKNLFGGLELAQKIVALVPNATIDTQAKTVMYTAQNVSGKVIFDHFKENTQYTIILSAQTTYSNLIIKYTDGRYSTVQANGVTVSTANKTIKRISGQWASGTTILNYEECGIFEGVLTSDDFVPYQGSTTPISWADEAGTVYGGYLEWLRDGSVRVTKTHESVNLSSLTWQRRTTNPYRFSASMPSGKDYTNAVDVSQHKCSIFPTAYTSGINNTKEGYLGIYRIPTQTGADNTIYLRFADTVTTLTELNAFLAETNPQYCYPLATPITYTLTPQEALVFLRGTNNVWNDINDTTVTYWTHKTGDSV